MPPPPLPASKSKKKPPEDVKKASFVFVLQLDSNSNVTLSVQKSESEISIGDIADTNSLTDFFTLLNNQESKSSKAPEYKINRSFIVKADPSLNFGSLADFLKKVRNFGGDSVRLETSKDFYDHFVFIPRKPENNIKYGLKPNPLTLIVQVTTDKKVTLNNEAEGTLDDLSSLKKKLAKIFKDRMDMGVFREGTNEVEQTVFIKASSLLQLSDVLKVVDALKEAGTSPVNLQIDDLQ
ncbi:MAG TPA: hypothetical protein VK308_09870 [Pyrinomonadaceae bacterium]|nr:hypothetical protein [Pyrinomonadaceae bacterium]